MTNKKLYRSSKNKIFGGVAGGLGQYFNIDPVFFRILFIVTALSGGIGIIVYLVSWLLIPEEAGDDQEKKKQSSKNDASTFLGFLILAVGTILLIKNIAQLDLWRQFWPILLIAAGLVLIVKQLQKS